MRESAHLMASVSDPEALHGRPRRPFRFEEMDRRRDGRVVEGGGLENRFPVLRNGASNPSPSDIFYLITMLYRIVKNLCALICARFRKLFRGSDDHPRP